MHGIEIDGVTRRYARGKGRLVTAVDQLSLHIRRGELFGILGPNGAGKTTLVRMITTTLIPDEGRISVLGNDTVRQVKAVRRSLGCVLGGERGLYDRLSGRDNLRYAAELYGVPRGRQARAIPQLLERVGLAGREQDRVETYSRGMKQRLHLARAMIHEPRVLVLDEPTIGLDPAISREIHQLIHEIRSSGTTVLLTTHYMLEAEFLCERLAVMNMGRLVITGTSADVKAAVPPYLVVQVDIRGTEQPLVRELREHPGVLSLQIENSGPMQRLRLQLHDDADTTWLGTLLGDLMISPVTQVGATLEDAYIRLIQSGDSRLPAAQAVR